MSTEQASGQLTTFSQMIADTGKEMVAFIMMKSQFCKCTSSKRLISLFRRMDLSYFTTIF